MSDLLKQLKEWADPYCNGYGPREPHEVIALLAPVLEAADNANREIQAQKTMWPGEVDTLDQTLADLRAKLDTGGNNGK